MADAVIEACGFLRNSVHSPLNCSHEHHRFVAAQQLPMFKG